MAKRDFVVSFRLLDKEFKKGIGGIKAQMNKLKGFATTALAGLGIANFGKSMIEAGKNFESGMARVKAVTNATEAQMKMMSDEAERLGATTKYSASQAAGALENLTRNGLKAEQATKALSKTLQLAQANSMELADAADLATNVMNGFGLTVDQLTRVNDNLSSTASHSATNALELGDAIKTVAPLANNCGISIEEVSAALGTLANVGIKGSDAGTALKQVLIGLSSETPKGAKAMAKYGLNINQATIAADGLSGTLKKLAESGIGQDNQALADVFGRRAFAGAAAVINNYEKFVDLHKTLQASSGETARMFSQASGNMDKAIKGLQSAWEALLISIFRSGEGGLVAPINALSDGIRKVRDNISTVVSVVKGAAVFAIIAKGITTLKVLWSSYTAGIIANVESMKIARANAEKLQTQLEKQETALRTQIAAAGAAEKQALMVRLNATAKQLEANRTLIAKAGTAERLAVERAAALQTASVWGKVGIALRGVGTALKAAFSMTIVTALIAGVVELVSHLSSMAKKSAEIKNIWSDYKKEANAVSSAEIEQLKAVQSELGKAAKGSEYYNALLKKAESLVGDTQVAAGKHKTIEEEINAKIKTRIKLLEAAAKAEFYTNKRIATEDKRNEILNKYDDGKHHYRVFVDRTGKIVNRREETADERYQRLMKAAVNKATYTDESGLRRVNDTGAYSEILEVQQLNRVINDASKQISENTKAQVMGASPTATTTPTGGTTTTGSGTGKSGKATPVFRETAVTIEEIEDNISALEAKLKKMAPNTAEFKNTTEEIKKWKDILDNIQNQLPEGSIAANEKAISDLEQQMKLTVDPASLRAIQVELDKFKKANEKMQMVITFNNAEISGKFKEGANIPMKVDVQVPKQKDVESKMKAVSDSVNANLVKAWQDAKDKTSKQQQTMLDATQQFANGMGTLGSAFEIPELNAAGTIAQAIANLIMSFSSASLQAASQLGPIGWAAFSLGGIAQLASIIAAVKSMGKFAEGGIVGGSSYSGDRLIAHVNSREMILNGRQQKNLFELLDSGDVGGGASGGDVSFRIRGDQLYGVLKNYTNVKSKTGRVTAF